MHSNFRNSYTGYKMIAAILIESGAYVAQNTTKSKLAVIGCVVQNGKDKKKYIFAVYK